MIIKNAVFPFVLLTNKLSRSKAFDTNESSKRTVIAGLVLVQSWTVTFEEINLVVISLLFLKKQIELLKVN